MHQPPLAAADPSEPPKRRLLAACRPWHGLTPRRRRAQHGLLIAPFILVYLVASWVIFLPAAERTSGNYSTNFRNLDDLVYHIPDLSQDFPMALRSLATAPWLNHNAVQLVYVTLLLLLFGVAFERHEGTRETILVFFWSSFAGALGAGALLHLVYPELIDNAFLANAWDRTWSGGSAGCFGLLGAIAARARNPWPLLGLVAAWEINVAYWYLNQYTPAFHVSALIAGFLAVRYAAPFVERQWLRLPIRKPGVRLQA